MTLRLTPEALRAAYEFLRGMPPFNRWRLPAPDYISFEVTSSTIDHGIYHAPKDGPHRIKISGAVNGHTATLLMTMAHEMVHLYQQVSGTATRAQHNAQFKRLAAQVCRHHGFDPKAF